MVPPRTCETDPQFQTDEVLLHEHTFSNHEDVPNLLDFLKRTHSTGTLVIHIVNGGKNKIAFTQRQAVETES